MVYMYHSFLIHSSADGHLGCFHVLGYDKQCCNEHWGARVSFRSGFLGVYAQKWYCWVIWQFSNFIKIQRTGPNSDFAVMTTSLLNAIDLSFIEGVTGRAELELVHADLI